jgi:hypothetical protein
MEVYSVIGSIPYEGYDLLGVFASYVEACDFAKMKTARQAYKAYGIIKSELGQEIDCDVCVEWVELV